MRPVHALPATGMRLGMAPLGVSTMPHRARAASCGCAHTSARLFTLAVPMPDGRAALLRGAAAVTGERIERRGAQRSAGPQAEAGVVPRASDLAVDDDSVGEWRAIVRARGADSPDVSSVAHEQHRFAVRVTDERCLAEVRFGNAGREVRPRQCRLRSHGGLHSTSADRFGADRPGAYSCSLAKIARVPGSLAVATIVTCAIFATATGIIGATVTLMGLLAFPAMLKAGYCQYELKRYDAARATLTRLPQEFPDSPAAAEANSRLARMKTEGR